MTDALVSRRRRPSTSHRSIDHDHHERSPRSHPQRHTPDLRADHARRLRGERAAGLDRRHRQRAHLGGARRALLAVSDRAATAAAAAKAIPATAEWFFFVVDGVGHVQRRRALAKGGFAYLPPGSSVRDCAARRRTRALLVFAKTYEPLAGHDAPAAFTGHEDEVRRDAVSRRSARAAESADPRHAAADMAVNVFTYDPGATLPFVETHVMEHGMLFLAGGGVYRLDADWHPVTAGDAIWIAPYCPQWFIAAGPGPARYIYYKDVNRLAGMIASRHRQPRASRSEIDELARVLRSAGARRDARAVLGDRPARARVAARALSRGRPRHPRGRRRQHLRALGRRATTRRPPSPPARTSTPFPTPAATTAWSACSAALEAIRALQRAGLTPRAIDRARGVHRGRADPLRHRLSRQPAAERSAVARAARRRFDDPDGVSLDDWRARAGMRAAAISRACGSRPAHYAAFVELHIEQGPIARTRAHRRSAWSTAIAGPSSYPRDV